MPGESERYRPYRVDEEAGRHAAQEKAAKYGSIEDGSYTTGRAGEGIIRRSDGESGRAAIRKDSSSDYLAQLKRLGAPDDRATTSSFSHTFRLSVADSPAPAETIAESDQAVLLTSAVGARATQPSNGRFRRVKESAAAKKAEAAVEVRRWDKLYRRDQQRRKSRRPHSLQLLGSGARGAGAGIIQSSGGGDLQSKSVSAAAQTPTIVRQVGRGAYGAAKFGVKSAAFAGKRTIGAAKFAAKAPRRIYTFAKNQKAAAKRIYNQARQQIGAVMRRKRAQMAAKAATMLIPLLLGMVLTVLPILVFIAQIPTITLKSTDKELNRIYRYITRLDAELTKEIREIPKSLIYRSIDPENVHVYVNGREMPQSFHLQTDADYLLRYFDAKYGDYAFDKVIYGLFGGQNVKNEIEAIHEKLYSVKSTVWTSEEVAEPIVPDDGVFVEDSSKTETVPHLDIRITVKKPEQELSDTLDDSEEESCEALDSVGIYCAQQELCSPFPDAWIVSQRWGEYCHRTKVEAHDGIDIRQRTGAIVSCVKNGVVSAVDDAGAHGSGKTVRVLSGDNEIVYSNLTDVTVEPGQTISAGTPIGSVGSGAFLHLEYSKDGMSVNPLFYVAGYAGSLGDSSGGVFTQAQQDIVDKALAAYENPAILGTGGTFVGCAAFCAKVYRAAGYHDEGRDAINYWADWQATGGTSRSMVPVGALVVAAAGGEDGGKYGHVGIYIGGGEIIHYSGRVYKHSFATFLSFCGGETAVTINNGNMYIGYQGWVWPDGIVLGTYADDTGC